MIELEEIKAGMNVEGFEPGLVVTVFAVTPIGDNSLQVYYKLPDGTIRERLITCGNENDIRVATVSRPWAFDGDGEAFKLAVEAKRIDLAFLFDPAGKFTGGEIWAGKFGRGNLMGGEIWAMENRYD